MVTSGLLQAVNPHGLRSILPVIRWFYPACAGWRRPAACHAVVHFFGIGFRFFFRIRQTIPGAHPSCAILRFKSAPESATIFRTGMNLSSFQGLLSALMEIILSRFYRPPGRIINSHAILNFIRSNGFEIEGAVHRAAMIPQPVRWDGRVGARAERRLHAYVNASIP
jgi:hypothetical protein